MMGGAMAKKNTWRARAAADSGGVLLAMEPTAARTKHTVGDTAVE